MSVPRILVFALIAGQVVTAVCGALFGYRMGSTTAEGYQLISVDFQRQKPIFLYDQRGYFHFDPLGSVRRKCEPSGGPISILLEFNEDDVIGSATTRCNNGATQRTYLVKSEEETE